MKDEKVIDSNNLTNLVDNVPQRPPSPYELLLRQNKKLGRYATNTFGGLKTILNYEIPLPSKEAIIENLPHLSWPKVGSSRKKDDIASLKNQVRKSHEMLATARTVFPMQLFPDRIILDRTKITIIRRDFFWSSNVVSIRVEDVLNVACGIGPLFGSITISSRVMNSVDHFEVNYLWRNDAMQLKNIIQGYVIAKHNNITIDDLDGKELMDTLMELGHDSDAR